MPDREHLVVDTPGVFISDRVAAHLWRYALADYPSRGRDAAVDGALLAVRDAGDRHIRRYLASQVEFRRNGTDVAVQAEPAASSNLTTSHAADIARCEPRTIRKAAEQGRLTATRPAGRWIITREALAAWMSTR